MDEDGTVFLIDDDPGVRDSLTLLLSLKGIRTQPFATAESFMETYRPEWTGCVLTDLRMPGMTGLELQGALRERQIDVPVVVLTAKNLTEDDHRRLDGSVNRVSMYSK